MAETLQYKCPCCGGAIEFDSASQKMKCPFCDSSFDIDTLKNYDEELHQQKESNMSWDSAAGGEWQQGETDNMRVYICKSCGGEIVGDENTGATSCPFCGNPVVMGGQFSGDLKPDCVIPFKLDKKAAKAAMQRHLHKKRLLPKVFKDQNHIDEIKGIYVPFWLFDTDADADIRYKATKTRSWSDSRYNYVKTSYYLVTREGTLSFDKVPVDGSSKMPDDLMESIEPFDYQGLVDFKTAFLSGYLADKYDVDAGQSVVRANERITKSTADAFARTVSGYSTVSTQSSNIRLSDCKVRYGLLPVWILNTHWNNQQFIFAMNGQTGKFVGNLPVDKGAWRRWFWGTAAAVTAGLFLLSFLGGII